MRRALLALLICLAPTAIVGQTEVMSGGIVADSTVAAPAISWNRFSSSGDLLSIAVSGWQVSANLEKRINPRRKLAMSVAVTPLHAHSSDHVYVRGERFGALEYDNAAAEISVGRVDAFTARWQSDIRAVLLYENVDSVDEGTRRFWSKPFAGVRTRQSYKRITAENPFRMTFEGTELIADAEYFVGKQSWSRFSGEQAASWRAGRLRFAERTGAFTGSSLNVVNRFLVGGSWPVPGVRPLYGYRYGEFRLRHGITLNTDLEYGLSDTLSITAHASALRGDDTRALGAAIDLTREWHGIVFRAGIGIPRQNGREDHEPVVYASVLAAAFR